MVTHVSLTGANLHEPKGAASASANQVYVANGSGSGAWTSLVTFLATAIAATTAEIVRIADVSVRNVIVGATLTVTEATHSDKTILLNSTGGSVVTLPAATGSGARFRFRVSVLATSASHIIKVANSSDIMQGAITMIDQDTPGTIAGFVTAAADDTVTLNRSTTGSVTRGEWVNLEDIATNLWAVSGVLTNTGTALTPFSATV